jgi:membrane protein
MRNRVRGALIHARDRAIAWARAVWNCDRTRLRPGAAFLNRTLRVLVASVRGLGVHAIGIQAAALTYYTVFSIVPLLVILLWIVKALGHIPDVSPELPNAHRLAGGNAVLVSALHKLFENVNRTAAVTGGIVSAAAFTYAVIRLFAYTERALDRIASATRRRLKLTRLLGYVGLLLLLPLFVTVGGFVAALASNVLGSRVSAVLGSFRYLKAAVIAAFGLITLALAIAIFYSAAARARIAFRSATVGAAVAATLLALVLWIFGTFQIGMSRGNAVQFGATAGPALLLWTYASWYVLLFGAEVAVAHDLDRVLIHGAWTLRPDVAGREEAGIAVMLRASRTTGLPPMEALARELRLPPAVVRDLCLRLAARGLLRRTGSGRFVLAADPERTHVADVVDAIIHDPALDPERAETAAQLDPGTRTAIALLAEARARAGRGPTLRELAVSADG